MTKNTRAAFENRFSSSIELDKCGYQTYKVAGIEKYKNPKIELAWMAWQASESRIMAELEFEEVIEKVAKAIFDKDLLNCGNWDWEVQNQPDLTKRYRGIAKAAIQAITNHIKEWGMNKKKIMYASDESAKLVTVIGWQSSKGHFFGNNEQTARYDGCTHRLCDCGSEVEKTYIVCSNCRSKKRQAQYDALPYQEFSEFPLTTYDDDRYFFDEDELLEYCENESIELSDLNLMTCVPNYAWEIGGDYYADILPEDTELEDVYPELAEAIGKVNDLIRKKQKQISWGMGKFRTAYKAKDTKQ